MKSLALDTESTTYQKGHPFSRRNRMCAVSWYASWEGNSKCIPWEHTAPVTADSIELVQSAIRQAELLIFFNAKRDLHWLRRCGIIDSYKLRQRVWDCQVAQFIISSQQQRYPSLDTSLAYFGLGSKSNVVETEYWDRGIDTPNVPWPILSEYASRDAELTYKLYEAQLAHLANKPELLQLIRLVCMDTYILAEMEYNGLILDLEECNRRAQQLQKEIEVVEAELISLVPVGGAKLNSPDTVSSILYGGTIRWVESVPYAHTYKGGIKAGLTETRFKHTKHERVLPRLVEPLPKSELKKEGYWSTDDGVLKRLKARGVAKQVIGLITKRNELERLLSTYYIGFPETAQEMDWEVGELHGQFNQCVVVTGRLSSSKPNLQNMPPEVDELIKSRF